MRIIHITPAGGFGRVQYGGAERAVADLATAAADRGHEVTIMAPSAYFAAAGLPPAVAQIPMAVAPRDASAIARRIARADADVVVLHLLRGVLVGGLALRLSGQRRACVTNLHNSLQQAFDDADAPAFRRLLLRRALRALHTGPRTVSVAISASNLHDLVTHDGLPVTKTALIPNWVHERFRPLPESERKQARVALGVPDATRPIVLFAGRLERQKDPVLAVATAARMRTAPVLVVAGAGSLRDAVLREARGSDVDVRLLGHLSNVEQQMAAADLLLVPSRYEGFGRVAVEALATGTPVVAADVPGLRDALDGFAATDARLEGSRDPAAWARSADSLLDTERTTATRGALAAQVAARYGAEQAVDQYLDLYETLRRR